MNNMNFPGPNSQSFPGEGPVTDTSDKGFDLRIDDIQHLYQTSLQIAEAFGEALGEGNNLVRLSGAQVNSSGTAASVTSGWAYYQGQVHRVVPASLTFSSGQKAVWVLLENETEDEREGRFLDDLSTQFTIKTVREITLIVESNISGRQKKIGEIGDISELLPSLRDTGGLPVHDHDDRYYTKENADFKFATKLQTGQNDLSLISDSGELLSKVPFQEVARSGDYNDLANLPTIPTLPAPPILEDFVPWADDPQKFLRVLCAGKVSGTGTRLDYWGPDNNNGFPFDSARTLNLSGSILLPSIPGNYRIIHLLGHQDYGIVGSGIGNGKLLFLNRMGDTSCDVTIGQFDAVPEDSAFTFMIYSTKL